MSYNLCADLLIEAASTWSQAKALEKLGQVAQAEIKIKQTIKQIATAFEHPSFGDLSLILNSYNQSMFEMSSDPDLLLPTDESLDLDEPNHHIEDLNIDSQAVDPTLDSDGSIEYAPRQGDGVKDLPPPPKKDTVDTEDPNKPSKQKSKDKPDSPQESPDFGHNQVPATAALQVARDKVAAARARLNAAQARVDNAQTHLNNARAVIEQADPTNTSDNSEEDEQTEDHKVVGQDDLNTDGINSTVDSLDANRDDQMNTTRTNEADINDLTQGRNTLPTQQPITDDDISDINARASLESVVEAMDARVKRARMVALARTKAK